MGTRMIGTSPNNDIGWPAPATSPGGALQLPPEQAEMLRIAEDLLTPLLGAVNYRLGGGTALAAFWRHRYSSDIDLFTDERTYRLVFGDDPVRHQDIAGGMAESLGAHSASVRRGHLKLALSAHKEVSLMTSAPPPVHDCLTAGHVQDSQVRIESPSVVLARKIVYRMGRNGDLTGRDLYDIVAARAFAPEALALAMDVARHGLLDEVANELARLPSGWIHTPASGRPVKNPTRPPEVAQNLDLVVNQAARIFGNGPAPLREEAMAMRPDGQPPDVGTEFSF